MATYPTNPILTNWTNWTTNTGITETGSLIQNSKSIDVTYTGNHFNVQHWSAPYGSPYPYYVNATVSNTPGSNGQIQMAGGTQQLNTIHFSQPVINPIIDVISIGSSGTPVNINFLNNPTIALLSVDGSSLVLQDPNLTGREGNGVLQFIGSYQDISFIAPNYENWYGFTVGALATDSSTPTPTPAVLNITATSADKTENSGAFTFTVNRTSNTSSTSTVNYAVSGGTATADDFTGNALPTGSVSFAANETSKVISIPVAGDTTVEPDDTFNLVLSNPTGATLGTSSASGTIRNDDTKTNPVLNIVATDANKNEGGGAFTFTVNRTGDTTTPSIVTYAVTGGTATADDFTGNLLPTGSVSFAANETSKIISIPVANDTTVELNETFNVVLSNPTGATLGIATATGTILNDDTPVLNIVALDANKNEGGGAFTFTVNRTGDTTGSPLAFYKVTGGTATADDFTNNLLPTGIVSFAPNETSKIISIPVANDSIVEPDETFNVVLSNPVDATLGIATATGTIRNDDTKTSPVLNIVATDADKKESSGAFTFTVNRTGDSSTVSTFDYAISGGTATADDFTPSIVRTVSFATSETSKIISIPVADDTTVEPDETFNVVLSNPTGATLGTASATGTIRDDDGVSLLPTVKGTLGDDDLLGTTADEQITGLAGNDLLSGYEGNDVLDGGDGIDKAVYTGNLTNFTITKTATGLTVKDNIGTSGTDTVKNIEQLKFDDASINLSVKTKAAPTNIPAATLKIIEELYSGFFKRIPDANGLEHWIDQYKAGQTVKQIADAFYDAGVQYGNVTGYSNTMTNDDFIKIVYANVLGRTGATAPAATDVAFWSNNRLFPTSSEKQLPLNSID
jgi:hypothetical protein